MVGHRILVVDDEPGVRFGIRDFLETHQYAVNEAATCLQAERSFQASRPDAVIIDYGLPDGSAFELLPRLKAIDARVPVMVLSAYGSFDLGILARRCGAAQFLTKPVGLPSLLAILERMIKGDLDQRR